MKGYINVIIMIIVFIVSVKSEIDSTCSAGRITYYDYSAGQCSFGSIGGPTLSYNKIVAPNDAFFGTDGSKCGVCYEVTGPDGTVVVQVVDRCPAGDVLCSGDMDHFDLGPDASTFGQIAPVLSGINYISKKEVACPTTGNVGVRTKDGVNAQWMAILVFNHRVGITNVQIEQGGSYHAMERQIYNYWIYSGSSLTAPFNVKITSKLGDEIVVSVTSLDSEKIYTADSQFPGPANDSTPCTV